jgi:alkanesulfonate monooxygenase SsuD/methylene tetrahydromethanopterin reductase-like flavin-dependent oxidoreductase (luciferase family)
MSLEAAEQIANMMAMTPYPGYSSPSFELPCRNVIPKPVQKPHPPMWMACTNRDTIRVAASRGLGVLAFSFVDPGEARSWSNTYYDTIASEHCVPLGHSVNPNLAMVTGFSVHPDRATAVERGKEHFEFFGFALNSLVASDTVPGRTRLWERYQEHRASQIKTGVEAGPGIGTPDDLRQQLRDFEKAGVDQVIFMQQCGRARHEHICESIERFATEVMPEFAEREQQGAAARAERLAPTVEAALARKQKMPALADDEIPVVRASVKRAQVNK